MKGCLGLFLAVKSQKGTWKGLKHLGSSSIPGVPTSSQPFHLEEINHAAHLIENFFQVAWYDHSRQIGKSPVETDINEVRPRFENALKVYQVVQNAADTLLYDAVARYGMIPGTPRLSTAPEVVLVLTVVGPWASVGIVTFWSILRTRSTPLAFQECYHFIITKFG